MENALDIINDVMDKHRFRHKRDVAEYFGVTPQALKYLDSEEPNTAEAPTQTFSGK